MRTLIFILRNLFEIVYFYKIIYKVKNLNYNIIYVAENFINNFSVTVDIQ